MNAESNNIWSVHEAQAYANHHVSALDSIHDVSLYGDTLRAKVGTPEAGGSTLIAVPILFVWRYGTLVIAERRSGYIIMLVGSLLGLAMPVFHVIGAEGVFRGQLAKSNGDFLFVWTLHALGLTAMLSLVLAARGLWGFRRSNPR